MAQPGNAYTQPPIVTGPDGRPWYAVADDEAGWRRFADTYLANYSGREYVATALFCATNSRLDPDGPGPVTSLMYQCDHPQERVEAVARWASSACKPSIAKHQCIDAAVTFAYGEKPLRPVIPADYAETVSARCDIRLRDGPDARDFIAKTNRARTCVLGTRMQEDGPLAAAISRRCLNHGPSERFSSVYGAALRNGASPAAAARAAQLINEQGRRSILVVVVSLFFPLDRYAILLARIQLLKKKPTKKKAGCSRH